MSIGDMSGFSMLDLFRMEAGDQACVLTDGPLRLERRDMDAALLESMMRAAHSIKGSAPIVGIESVVRLSHAMKDVFMSAQHGRLALDAAGADRLLAAVDLMLALAEVPEGEADESGLDAMLDALAAVQRGEAAPAPVSAPASTPAPALPAIAATSPSPAAAAPGLQAAADAPPAPARPCPAPPPAKTCSPWPARRGCRKPSPCTATFTCANWLSCWNSARGRCAKTCTASSSTPRTTSARPPASARPWSTKRARCACAASAKACTACRAWCAT